MEQYQILLSKCPLLEIIRDGVCIQSMVKGLNDLHKQINRLLDVPVPCTRIFNPVGGNSNILD